VTRVLPCHVLATGESTSLSFFKDIVSRSVHVRADQRFAPRCRVRGPADAWGRLRATEAERTSVDKRRQAPTSEHGLAADARAGSRAASAATNAPSGPKFRIAKRTAEPP